MWCAVPLFKDPGAAGFVPPRLPPGGGAIPPHGSLPFLFSSLKDKLTPFPFSRSPLFQGRLLPDGYERSWAPSFSVFSVFFGMTEQRQRFSLFPPLTLGGPRSCFLVTLLARFFPQGFFFPLCNWLATFPRTIPPSAENVPRHPAKNALSAGPFFFLPVITHGDKVASPVFPFYGPGTSPPALPWRFGWPSLGSYPGYWIRRPLRLRFFLHSETFFPFSRSWAWFFSRLPWHRRALYIVFVI